MPDAGAAAPVTVAAPVALDTPPPPPADITSLADAQFSTGRPEAPESTIGGQTTCIVCFVNPKSHAAVPCGHWCTCGEECSAQMQACPVCRGPLCRCGCRCMPRETRHDKIRLLDISLYLNISHSLISIAYRETKVCIAARDLNYVPYTLSPREIEAGVRRYLVL